jgi:hypothetical protein
VDFNIAGVLGGDRAATLRSPEAVKLLRRTKSESVIR